MPRIYLMRHGKTAAGPEKTFYGITDLPLAEDAGLAVDVMGRWLREHAEIRRIYTSPLLRCRDTAKRVQRQLAGEAPAGGPGGRQAEEPAADRQVFRIPAMHACPGSQDEGEALHPVLTVGDLREINLGTWEGRTFADIQQHEPEAFAARGQDIASFRTPGGETFEEAGRRFVRAASWCAEDAARQAGPEKKDSDILIVAHAGVIRAALCLWSGTGITAEHLRDIHLPPASLTERTSGMTGMLSEELLDDAAIAGLYERCHTPPEVIAHMRAVRLRVEELTDLTGGELISQKERLIKAALVHDILRTERNHEKEGAELLRAEGFHEIADIVAAHNSETMYPADRIYPEEILFLADKTVLGDKTVSIEERFEVSRGKFRNAEAIRHHEARKRKALYIQEKLERGITGGGAQALPATGPQTLTGPDTEETDHETHENRRSRRADALS